MIDDAQFTYVNKGAWSSLFKTVAMWLPSSIKFIISATHVLKSCAESPVEFEWLPTLNRQRFLLSDAEARQFLDSEIGLRSDMKYESLIQCIILQCGGLIGALRLSVDSLTAEFKESYHPSENECLLYCLSADALSQMTHVFGSAHSFPIDARFRNFLASCFTSGLTAAPPILESNDAISLFNLQKAGILVERNGLIGFSSPLAQQYYIQWLFPYRSSTPPESLHALLKSCIQNFSPSLLAQSAVDGFPKEATFQHLLMEGLAKFTPPGCAICPDLLKVCPGEIQTGGCLFYLNGSLRWGIELLVLGRDIGSHINRFGDAGNYSKLAVKDFAVLDFRVSSDGEPTNVERHVKRVSVFFKAGDFSQCKCIFGLKEDVVLLNLNM
ncbi:hypothetical protein BDR26DRAFT_883581 [Obelidium mucronatum]|nr:hypothetical protein BDR26DRAFT_883581 [Obelidium mucronatum]